MTTIWLWQRTDSITWQSKKPSASCSFHAPLCVFCHRCCVWVNLSFPAGGEIWAAKSCASCCCVSLRILTAKVLLRWIFCAAEVLWCRQISREGGDSAETGERVEMVIAALPAVPSVVVMATEFARRLMASRKGRERGGEAVGGGEEDMVGILQDER